MTDDEGWEARMAQRAAERAERGTRTPGTPPEPDDPARRAPRPWLNGWPRTGRGREVLMGTEVRCVCCGRSKGVTTVAFPPDWQPPGPDPVWPFGEEDCPLCWHAVVWTDTFNRSGSGSLGSDWTSGYDGFGLAAGAPMPRLDIRILGIDDNEEDDDG